MYFNGVAMSGIYLPSLGTHEGKRKTQHFTEFQCFGSIQKKLLNNKNSLNNVK